MHSIKKMIENRRNREIVYSRADYWDEKAICLDGDAVSMWPNNNLNELYGKEHFPLVESWLQNLDGLRILDIGCGTGRMSRYFAKRGARVSGFDFSAKAIDLARCQTKGENPVYRVCSVFDLVDEDIYDIALSWGVLTIACANREQLKGAMSRIRHALKPGGTLVLLEPIHKGFLHRVLAMDIEEFTDVMTEEGFDVRTIQNLHFWPVRLLLAYLPWPEWITSPIYNLGQWLMQRFRNQNSGDYKAIYAVARSYNNK
jgi:2-polyprenyl-3-methyl-5-hydroxy-6-metoxy-1,4-benzoquinol methylase